MRATVALGTRVSVTVLLSVLVLTTASTGRAGQSPAAPLELLAVSDLVEIGYQRSRVVILNEGHSGLLRSRRTRLVGRLVMPRAHAAGVRHLAAEALTPKVADEANRTRILPDSDHAYLAQDDMRALLQTALDLGWTLISYEVDFDSSDEDGDPLQAANWRERGQAQNLSDALAGLPTDARLLVWSGNSHLEKEIGVIPNVGEMVPMGRWFWDLAGIEPFSIDQVVSVDFGGAGGRAANLVEQFRAQLEVAPGRTLGYLTDPAVDAGADARVISLDNALS